MLRNHASVSGMLRNQASVSGKSLRDSAEIGWQAFIWPTDHLERVPAQTPGIYVGAQVADSLWLCGQSAWGTTPSS